MHCEHCPAGVDLDPLVLHDAAVAAAVREANLERRRDVNHTTLLRARRRAHADVNMHKTTGACSSGR